MTSFKYTAATLALLLASGLSYAANTTTTTTTEQPAAAQNAPECPAAGTVAEADLSAECKNQAAMPKQDGTSTTGAAETVQPDANAAATTDMPMQDDAAATATTEVPKQDDAAATATTEVPQQDDAAATATTELPDTAADTAVTDTNAAATTEEIPKQDAATAPVDDATEQAVTEAKASTSMLASQFMGQTVYSASNENVGEINDIVMNRELDNLVVILGVGGFLGIGEKDVAISIDEITAIKDENNNLKLTIAATKEQLEAAPTFDRTALN